MTNYEPTDVRRGQLPSAELMNDLQAAAAQASRAGGYGMVQYPDGNVFLPPDLDEIWIIITGQGSGSGRGGSGTSGTGENDNYYEWTQGQVVIDDAGNESVEVDPSGLYGTQQQNPAIEVNGSTSVPDGYICRAYLSPSKNAWHFVYGGAGGNSSSMVTCPDGSRFPVTFVGDTEIIVGDAL